MLAKLAVYGIVGSPHQWFSSYLTMRERYCQIGGQRLSRKVVKHRIRQGSCLGELLFILYVSDFAQRLVKSSPNMYADDTSVIIIFTKFFKVGIYNGLYTIANSSQLSTKEKFTIM